MRAATALCVASSLMLFSTYGTVQAQSSSSFEVIRLNNSQPIIDQDMFAEVGERSEGENINGPSLIRIPDWIASQDRAHPSAEYYLYFGHHDGEYIRMAWAEEVTGPWHLYQTGSSVPVGDRGVLDNGTIRFSSEEGDNPPELKILH